jgi:hypothetical protein
MQKDIRSLTEVFVPETIANLHRQYPNALLHHLDGENDVRSPRSLHPAFYGSYDWHSSVHSHWQLVRALRLFPDALFVDKARDALNRSLTAEHIVAEMTYVADRRSFEIPYGMAWLLQLVAELHEWDRPDARRWRQALAPLEQQAAEHLTDYFNRLPHPIRGGLHNQTAFAMGLMLDWTQSIGAEFFADQIRRRATEFYICDRNAPLAYEPSGVDFLSPSLAEADLMRRVLPQDEFVGWLDGFLNTDNLPEHFTPAVVIDASDGQLAHFAGLNMSRAWMLQGIASALPAQDQRLSTLKSLASQHLELGLANALDDDYMVAHWAPTFILYLLTRRGITS